MKPETFMRAALAVLALAMGPQSLEASTVIPMDLRQCVEYSGLAFAGTVSGIKPEYTPSHSTIVTRVTFSHIAVAKGEHPDSTLIMTLEGGRVGSVETLVPGQPQFEMGRRYVLLVDADLGSADNSYLPVI